MDPKIKEKISGCLWGQAIGDALGLGTEFMSSDEIKRNYPEGLSVYEQIIQDRHRKRWTRGDWTDDTEMMLCIANAIIKDREINPDTVAHNFKQWFNGKPMGIGLHTYNVLWFKDYEYNPIKASDFIWELSHRKSASNGGVMRTSIVGLWKMDVVKNAENICRLTHADPRCVGSCVIISEVINQLVWYDCVFPFEAIIEIGNRYDKRIQEYLMIAKNGKLDELCLDEEYSMGYTLKTLACAIWCLYYAESFEDGLLKVVNAGGDADTNAAVSCAVLGAKYGVSGIPDYYINGLNRKDYYENMINDFIDVLMTFA